MTLLVSWVGVDTHGTASAYIAADSRVSWSDTANFDNGRKVFAFRRSPDIVGYCGDVVFPSIVLSQITEMADCGLLFAEAATCEERCEAIKDKLVQQFNKYPAMVKSIMSDSLQILHVSRDFSDKVRFACWKTEWTRGKGWHTKVVPLPNKSTVLFVLGSGGAEFNENLHRYESGPDHGTSRNVFHCFCDTLFSIKDKNCGGAPQLVGLYRKPSSSGITYGIIRDHKRYFLGAQIDDGLAYQSVEWRNDFFERCDGQMMRRLDKAQPQPDSLRRI